MSELGKRYVCASCGGEVLCTSPGPGDVSCCGKPMERLQPKPLPSSD